MKEGKNKRFLGEKWTQEYSQKTLLELEATFSQSITSLKGLKVKQSKNKKGISNTISMSKKFLTYVKKELKFLKSLDK